MKASIRDTNVLRSIKPLELTAYLRAHQWKEVERQEGRFARWYKNGDGEGIEILLPLNRELRDYTSRIAEAIHALEVDEERSQLAIVTDVSTISDDVTRIGAEHQTFADGSMLIEQATRFVEHTYALLLAAACGAARPREVYFSRKPQPAVDYMKRVRMGQSERGSYILTAYAPIPPTLRAPEQLSFLSPASEPFERRVSQTLMQALVTVRAAADQAAASGEFRPFLDAVSQGVSANLCDAIVGLQEGTDADQIRVQMHWSPLRQVRADSVSKVVIASDAIPVIKEAARFLREAATRDDFELRGFVVSLRRSPGAVFGHITVSGFFDGAIHNVQLDLHSGEYEQAVTAHQQRLPVQCIGELAKEGRSYVLRQPRDFMVEHGATSNGEQF